MTAQSYSTKFVVDRTPEQAFVAITRVRDWWPEIEGSAVKIGDTFKHRFEDMHRCELVVKDMIPGKKSSGPSSTTTSASSRTRLNGRVRTSCSRSSEKATRPKSSLLMWALSQSTSATTSARMRGANSSTAHCAVLSWMETHRHIADTEVEGGQ